MSVSKLYIILILCILLSLSCYSRHLTGLTFWYSNDVHDSLLLELHCFLCVFWSVYCESSEFGRFICNLNNGVVSKLFLFKMNLDSFFCAKPVESSTSLLFSCTMVDALEFSGNAEGLLDAMSTKYHNSFFLRLICLFFISYLQRW